jgi:hypothetical protein
MMMVTMMTHRIASCSLQRTEVVPPPSILGRCGEATPGLSKKGCSISPGRYRWIRPLLWSQEAFSTPAHPATSLGCLPSVERKVSRTVTGAPSQSVNSRCRALVPSSNTCTPPSAFLTTDPRHEAEGWGEDGRIKAIKGGWQGDAAPATSRKHFPV